jgi:hypothetical protein
MSTRAKTIGHPVEVVVDPTTIRLDAVDRARADADACCGPAERESCCEPAAKADCCGL